MLAGKRVLVTGGAGSLGRVLVRRVLNGELGTPESVTVFSRDEAKHYAMREAFAEYDRLRFRLGDVGDFHAVVGALRNTDVVFHCAAMKQIPQCEYAPFEAVRTNIESCKNIVRAICDLPLQVETVAFISTDKACQPLNLYGMTKAVQERLLIEANLECDTRFVGVRYGNVLGSHGSILPLLHDQIRHGGPVTITSTEMTRFLMSLDDAVDTVFAAVTNANRGEMYVPRLPAARIADVADVLIDGRPVATSIIGVRPGEKIHETLIATAELWRTVERGSYYVIMPTLPELRCSGELLLAREYCSSDTVATRDEVAAMISANKMRLEDAPVFQ
jgi:FlaA1/EpsC-like NDP-sugar epimerase